MENKLNELNIFALRDLARRTGVKSPTSKKKEELIQGIVEIMSGKKHPEMNKTKQGRPPKVFGYDFANVFNANLQTGSTVILNQDVKDVQDGDMMTVAGWLELVNNNSGILWVNKNLKNDNYFVPQKVMADLELRMGDRIVAEVCNDESQKIVKRIFSINDCPIQHLEKRREYSLIEHCLPERQLNFKNVNYQNLNLKIGENVYIYGENNNANTLLAVDILNQCEIENKIYINISLAEKNKMFLKDLKNCENFIAYLTDEIYVVRRIVFLAIERAKRILEIGENVMIVVDDMMSISGIDKDNLNLVKKLVSTTKEGKDLGSITLVAVMPNHNLVQIEKLADQRFLIEDNKIVKI